jgi:protein-tyrosine-phosphatase
MHTVCFVCQWNEGRSAHLELVVAHRLKEMGRDDISVISAGLSQGGCINPIRANFLARSGVPLDEIEGHCSTLFGREQAASDLVLTAEMYMKDLLLVTWPELAGRIMTVRGFLKGLDPQNEDITDDAARIDDAGGHSDSEKLALYAELNKIGEQVAEKLLSFDFPD